ncbi:MAG: hypothetical protein P9L97_09795 [Candidatus Tenebribacter davisii]|nr:hypothetical protein [Candidatus Tenebribacter davisii]
MVDYSFLEDLDKKATNKRVSGRLRGGFVLNRTDSGLVGLFGRDRSDPAAHGKHYKTHARIFLIKKGGSSVEKSCRMDNYFINLHLISISIFIV